LIILFQFQEKFRDQAPNHSTIITHTSILHGGYFSFFNVYNRKNKKINSPSADIFGLFVGSEDDSDERMASIIGA